MRRQGMFVVLTAVVLSATSAALAKAPIAKGGMQPVDTSAGSLTDARNLFQVDLDRQVSVEVSGQPVELAFNQVSATLGIEWGIRSGRRPEHASDRGDFRGRSRGDQGGRQGRQRSLRGRRSDPAPGRQGAVPRKTHFASTREATLVFRFGNTVTHRGADAPGLQGATSENIGNTGIFERGATQQDGMQRRRMQPYLRNGALRFQSENTPFSLRSLAPAPRGAPTLQDAVRGSGEAAMSGERGCALRTCVGSHSENGGQHAAERAPHHAPRSPVAAHPVDAAARGRRRRTEEDVRRRRRVRIDPGDRPGKQLPEVGEAAVDVAAHVVRVVLLRRDRTGSARGAGGSQRAARFPQSPRAVAA